MKFLLLQPMAESHGYSRFGRSLEAALGELGHEASVLDLSAHADGRVVQTAPLVGNLLKGKGEAFAARAHDRALKAGLWRHRAQQLVDFVQKG